MQEEIYQQLLQRESEWLEREGQVNEHKWIEEGINLQRQLMKACSGEVRHISDTQVRKLREKTL
jgi:hypothetical protein